MAHRFTQCLNTINLILYCNKTFSEMIKMKTKACADCKHFEEYKNRNDSNALAGYCTRFPPSIVKKEDTGKLVFMFPLVTREMKCGEFA